jgi:hypothetical protein
MKKSNFIHPFSRTPKYSRKLPLVNAIYVVNTDMYGNKVNDYEFKKRISDTEEKFLSMFGGYANENISHGKFISKTGKVIEEKVARIRSFTNIKTFESKRKELESWILKIKKEWNQEAIAYEFGKDL